MTNVELMQSYIAFLRAYQFLYNAKTEGGVSAFVGIDERSIHITLPAFREMFKDKTFKHSSRTCDKYPHRIETYFEGVCFFAICTEEDYQKLF